MKRLGVLGGMGPAASAEFMVRLTALTPATCDQEHIPTILWSDPRIPDRSTSVRNGDDLPLPWLIKGVEGLRRAGCDYVAIPCNTAHFWHHKLSGLGPKILHIVDSVAIELKNKNINDCNIAILGTQSTIESGLYQYRLNKFGWNCLTPSKEQMDDLIQPAINLIKSGKIDESKSMIMEVIDSLIAQNIKAVVLGCTELPLAIRDETYNGIALINSIDSLVRLSIDACWENKYTYTNNHEPTQTSRIN
jgi:aspartate racemase